MSGHINNHVVAAYLMVGLTVLVAALALAQAQRLSRDPEPVVAMVSFVAAGDRIVVVAAPDTAAWSNLQVAASLPARLALNEPAALSSGQLSLGGQYATLATRAVVSGDVVHVCAVGLPADLTVSVRDVARDLEIFQARLSVPACR